VTGREVDVADLEIEEDLREAAQKAFNDVHSVIFMLKHGRRPEDVPAVDVRLAAVDLKRKLAEFKLKIDALIEKMDVVAKE